MPRVTPDHSIYLDYNATTPPFESVLEEVSRASRIAFANPGSIHGSGKRAKEALVNARTELADLLGATSDQIVITSGGTESINMALVGRAKKILSEGFNPGKIALQQGDHPASSLCAEHLRSLGWRETRLTVDRNGQLDSDAVSSMDWQPGDILTVMLAHNETGVLQDASKIRSVANRLGERGVWTHVDAVQAVGKIDVQFADLGVDSLSIAAHKFHCIRGIGALCIRDPSRIEPLLFGGGQERGLRPGTECVPLVAGMVKALAECKKLAPEVVCSKRDRFERELTAHCKELNVEIVVHGQAANRLPNTSFVSFVGQQSAVIVSRLADAGVYCSKGAACKSAGSVGSEILTAMGCRAEVTDSAVRFSFDASVQENDIDLAIERISSILKNG